jgi:hypothetical protein
MDTLKPTQEQVLFPLEGYVWSNIVIVIDLWQYNMTSGEFTMVKTNGHTYYIGSATRGVGTPDTFLDYRRGFGLVYHSKLNSLFVFGGERGGNRNDVWRFNFSTNLWIWVAGNRTVNEEGRYEVLGQESPLNYPAPRQGHSMVYDPKTTLIYTFGGKGGTSNQYLNDLWAFNATSLHGPG